MAHLHRHGAQMLAAAWPRDAFASAQFETRAMHGAHQQAIATGEELARRPVQAPTSVRTYVEPCACVLAIAMQDQRLDDTIDQCFGLHDGALVERVEVGEHLRGVAVRDIGGMI